MITPWKKINEYLYIRKLNGKIYSKVDIYSNNYFVAKIRVDSDYCIIWDLYSFNNLFDAIIFIDIETLKRIGFIQGFGIYED